MTFEKSKDSHRKILNLFYYSDLGEQGFSSITKKISGIDILNYFQAYNSSSFKAMHIYEIKIFKLAIQVLQVIVMFTKMSFKFLSLVSQYTVSLTIIFLPISPVFTVICLNL